MDDDIHDFRKPLHEPIFDDVRERMGFAERCVRVQPEMQIDEDVVCRAARADLLGADDSRH